MFPGGRKRARESDKDCLRREIKEELPRLKLGRFRLWKEVKAKNRRSGRKMSDAIFVTAKASGRLTIGDKKKIDKETWGKPRGIRLTPTSRYIRDKLFLAHNAEVEIWAIFATRNSLKLHMMQKLFSTISNVRAITQKLCSQMTAAASVKPRKIKARGTPALSPRAVSFI